MQEKERRETETITMEGEVAGHFIKFVDAKTRPFYERLEVVSEEVPSPEPKQTGKVFYPPKIMCGVLVEVFDGQDRIPVNVRQHEKSLPEDVDRDKVTKKVKQAVYKTIEKAYPITTSVKVRRITFLDNNYRKFTLID